MFGECYTCRGARPFVSVIALDERNVYLQELNSPIRPELSYRYMNYTVCVFRMGMFVMSEGYHGVYNATHVIYKSLKSK